MPKDDRDILEVLKFELDFLEHGGYGRSVRTPWKESSIFQDSLSCINFGDPDRTRPCDECLLMAFVPKDQQGKEVPCHHIPLNEKGETVAKFVESNKREDCEEAYKAWLRKLIKQIETERAELRTQ